MYAEVHHAEYRRVEDIKLCSLRCEPLPDNHGEQILPFF